MSPNGPRHLEMSLDRSQRTETDHVRVLSHFPRAFQRFRAWPTPTAPPEGPSFATDSHVREANGAAVILPPTHQATLESVQVVGQLVKLSVVNLEETLAPNLTITLGHISKDASSSPDPDDGMVQLGDLPPRSRLVRVVNALSFFAHRLEPGDTLTLALRSSPGQVQHPSARHTLTLSD